ncbi:MAG: DUF6398 domain-containing protein [bacterium]
MARSSKSEKVPKEMQPTFDAIVVLTDRFCEECLNKEYAQLARQATASLCRKRLSPVSQGKYKNWACGIIYAIGSMNFLFDKSQDLYINATDLCEWFEVSKNTGAAKSKEVRDHLKMNRFDATWCLPSKLDSHPMAWMLTINGFIVDVRSMSREVQEIAYEKGLIPYIPADKEEQDGL